MRHYKSEDRRVSSQQCQELEIQETNHIQQRQKKTIEKFSWSRNISSVIQEVSETSFE